MLCAICDNTNDTPNICDPCRAKPENKGWSHSEWRLWEGADIPAAAQQEFDTRRDKPVKDATSLTLAILDLALSTRNKKKSIREIARELKCSSSWAHEIVRKYSENN